QLRRAPGLGQAAPPGAATGPDQGWGRQCGEVGQQQQAARVAAVAQPAARQCASGAGAHQPGGGDEPLDGPAELAEQFDAPRQTFAGALLVEAEELAFAGIDAAHEPVARVPGWWFVVTVVETMQHQFVTAGQALVEEVAQRAASQRVAMVEVGYHQPG